MVADLIIVISGILIAYELQSWDAARKDRAAYVSYLHRIDDDLSTSIAVNRRFQQEAAENAQRGQRAVAMLEACEVPADRRDEFVSALYLVGKVSMPMLRSDALDELRSVGKGNLLHDDLRRALGDLEQDQQRSDALIGQLDLRLASRLDVVSERVRFRLNGHTHPNFPITADMARYDLRALCGDPAFINAVSALAEIDQRVAIANTRRIERQEAARAVVRHRLGGKAEVAPSAS